MNTMVLLVMCIARMIYLMLPAFTIMLGIQAVVYRTTGISLFNELVNILSK